MLPPGPQGGISDEFDSQLNDPGQYDNPQDPASLSVVEHLRALSIRGKLVLLYVTGALTYLLLKFDMVSLSAACTLYLVLCMVCPVGVTAAVSKDAMKQ